MISRVSDAPSTITIGRPSSRRRSSSTRDVTSRSSSDRPNGRRSRPVPDPTSRSSMSAPHATIVVNATAIAMSVAAVEGRSKAS
jgi:hypothetical protein